MVVSRSLGLFKVEINKCLKDWGIEGYGELAEKRSWGQHRSTMIIWMVGQAWGAWWPTPPPALVGFCDMFTDYSLHFQRQGLSSALETLFKACTRLQDFTCCTCSNVARSSPKFTFKDSLLISRSMLAECPFGEAEFVVLMRTWSRGIRFLMGEVANCAPGKFP